MASAAASRTRVATAQQASAAAAPGGQAEQLHWQGLRDTNVLMEALPIERHLEQVLTR